MTATVITALKEARVFGLLPESELALLAAAAREGTTSKARLLYAAGEPYESLFCVLSGSIQVQRSGEDGGVTLISSVQPGGWVSWLGCFQDTPLPNDLWASAGSAWFAIPKSAVQQCAATHPLLYPPIIAEIGVRMSALLEWVSTARAMDDERALAHTILTTCRAEWRNVDGPIEIGITHEQLGRLGFGSRQRVGRLLSNLQGKSLLEYRYGRIQVPSLKAIEDYLAHDKPKSAVE